MLIITPHLVLRLPSEYNQEKFMLNSMIEEKPCFQRHERNVFQCYIKLLSRLKNLFNFLLTYASLRLYKKCISHRFLQNMKYGEKISLY